jgi:hypothetical protein
MGVVNEYIKEAKAKQSAERATEGNEKKEEIKGPDLATILRDKNQASLYTEYLQQEAQEGRVPRKLVDKIVSGETFSKEDNEALAETRRGYLEIKHRADRLAETLDEATMQELIESSPDFKKMGEIYGAQNLAMAIKRHLPKIAFTERVRFAQLDRVGQLIAATRDELRKEEEDITKLRKKYGGLTTGEFKALMQGEELSTENAKEYKTLGFWDKRFKRASTIKREVQALANAKADKIYRFMETNQKDLKDMGAFLEATLTENDGLNSTLVDMFQGERLESNAETGFAITELRSVTLTQSELDKAKKEFNLSRKVAADAEIPDTEFDNFADFFAKDTDKRNSKRGILGQFWYDLLGKQFKEKVVSMMKAKK